MGDWGVASTREALLAEHRPASSVVSGSTAGQVLATGIGGSITSARLTVRVFDVDFACNQQDCERDEIYLNGTRLTNPVPHVTGAHDQWSIVSFNVDPALVRQGANEVRIVIDVLGAGWCLEADWGQLEVTKTGGTTQTYRTDTGPDLDLYQPCDGGDNLIRFDIDVFDIQVKEIFATNDIDIQGIGNKVYDRSSGATQPIADNAKNSLSGSSWDGSFTLDTHFDAGSGAFPAETFQVEYAWMIPGTTRMGSGTFSVTAADASEEITINMPTAVGRYSVDLDFTVKDSNGNIVSMPDPPDLTLYATLSSPIGAGSTPRVEWLDKATDWASGATTDTAVVAGVWNGIYNQSGWMYRDVLGSRWQQLSSLGGSSAAGNCYTFAYAWQGLSQTLGVNAKIARTVRGTGTFGKFLTKAAQSLDGITGNAHPPGGALDRWIFSSHQVGVYGGVYYDPTFGKTWTGRLDQFVEAYATGGSFVGGLPSFQAGTRTVTKTRANPNGWGDWEYMPTPTPTPPAAPPSAPGTAPSLVLAVAAGSQMVTNAYGVDDNADGVFDRLAFDVSFEATSAGLYELTGFVSSGGQFVTDRASAYHMIEASVPVDAAASGTYSATIEFSGEDIFRSALDGPYTASLTLIDPDGNVTPVTFTTGPMASMDFGELPGSINSVTAAGRDADANGRFEDLAVSIDVAGRAASDLYLEASAYSPAGDFLGTANGMFNIVAGAQTVELLIDGAFLKNSGMDGPYDVEVVAYDDQFIQIDSATGQTAALDHMDFESRGEISGNYSDAGVDTNGNGFFDQLAVELDATVASAGTYNAEASLYDAQGAIIQTQISSFDMQTGVNRIGFQFDGRTIFDHGADGPYAVRYIALSDQNGLDVVEDAFTTNAYLATEFEPQSTAAIQLTDNYTDMAVDDDNDGILDRLLITAEVSVHQGGNYDMNGRLLDAAGEEIEFAAITRSLDADQTYVLELSFDGDAIFNNGGDGPFTLNDLSTYLTSDPSDGDFRSAAYTTAFYRAADFGIAPVGSIHGRKWHDRDTDGVRDAGEPWLNGWTIQLLDANGQVVDEVVTMDMDLNGDGVVDVDTERGWYWLDDIPAGIFSVREVQRPGWAQSFPHIDPVAQRAFDADQQFNMFSTGSEFEDWGGRGEKWVFSDNGWLFITPDGRLWQWDGSPRFDLTGTLVAELSPGHHADLSLVYDAADPALVPIAVGAGETIEDVDFGNYPTGSIHGRKWHDRDGDGVRSPDEEWLNGWTIELVDDAGTVVATAVTGDQDLNNDGVIDPDTESGRYWIDQVVSGDYTVREMDRDGWVQTYPNTALAQQAFDLDQQLDLRATDNDFRNWGGLDERWMWGAGGQWYFVDPAGVLFRWDRSSRSALSGTQVAAFSPAYHANLSLLTDALEPGMSRVSIVNGETVDGVDFGNRRDLPDPFHLCHDGHPADLFGGNVRARRIGRDLYIDGDLQDNGVQVFTDDAGDVFVAGIGNTLVNGQAAPWLAYQGTGRVDDDLQVSLIAGDNLLCLHDLWMDDLRIFGGSGIDGVLGHRVQVDDSTDIYTQAGGDFVIFDESSLRGRTDVHTASGMDSVAVFRTQLAGRTHVFTGSDADTVLIDDSRFDDHTHLNTGSDDDTVVGLSASRYNADVLLFGGPGTDGLLAHPDSLFTEPPQVSSFEAGVDDIDAILDAVFGHAAFMW